MKTGIPVTGRRLLALALAGTTLPAAASHGPDAIARFDQQAGLAASAHTDAPRGTNPRRGAISAGPRAALPEFAIRRRLASTAQLSDGHEATLFDGDYNGAPATFVRDADALTVSILEPDGIRLRAFHAGLDEPVDTFLPAVTTASDDDTVPGSPMAKAGRAFAADDAPLPKDPTIVAFLHDELTAGRDTQDVERRLLASHFAWWVKRMEFDIMNDPNSTAFRPVVRRVRLLFRSNVPGITSMEYGYDGVVASWKNVAQTWREEGVTDVPGGLAARWSLLLTRNMPSPGAAGISEQTEGNLRGRYGLASVDDRGDVATPAHEIGHMMGALHERAETRSVGLFGTCVTLMYYRAGSESCRTYSLPNTALIRNELDRALPAR